MKYLPVLTGLKYTYTQYRVNGFNIGGLRVFRVLGGFSKAMGKYGYMHRIENGEKNLFTKISRSRRDF